LLHAFRIDAWSFESREVSSHAFCDSEFPPPPRAWLSSAHSRLAPVQDHIPAKSRRGRFCDRRSAGLPVADHDSTIFRRKVFAADGM
jgi:hypothetical protein